MSEQPTDVLEQLMRQVADSLTSSRPETDHTLEVLLADFLTCVECADLHLEAQSPIAAVAGQAGTLAMRAHAGDRDDIDWTLLIHPGSIVWPAVLSVAMGVEVDGGVVRESALMGYGTTRSVARLLGPEHASRWHLTSTAGHGGAAVAAAAVLGLREPDLVNALSHGLSATGGVGQATLERSGTTMVHRAVAAQAGVTAAVASAAGVPASRGTADGAKGVLTLLADGTRSARSRLESVVDTPLGDVPASVRAYPVTGLAQSAIEAVLRLRDSWTGVPAHDLTLRVPQLVFDVTTAQPLTPWWDLRRAAAQVWVTGDPWTLQQRVLDQTRPVPEVRLVPRVDAPITWAEVVVDADGVERTVSIDAPPGAEPLVERALVRRKWREMLGPDERLTTGLSPVDQAREILVEGSPSIRRWWSAVAEVRRTSTSPSDGG